LSKDEIHSLFFSSTLPILPRFGSKAFLHEQKYPGLIRSWTFLKQVNTEGPLARTRLL
jgi:hypothetical protein